VSTSIHARPFAAAVPNARLVVRRDLGHMVQIARPDLVRAEIEAILAQTASVTEAAD
jgi:pimeloyl-ACP methyl ester carboxylesterase